MTRLNADPKRQTFEVNWKTVVLVDGKQSESPKLQRLVSEVEKRGGRVVFTGELIHRQQQAEQARQAERRLKPQQNTNTVRCGY
jgi:hypothetical protein